MRKAKIAGTKKLSLRKDLFTNEVKTYFKEGDYFFVDDTDIFYDRKNNPYYAAESKYGEEGFVITTGVIFLKEEDQRHGQHIKNSS